MTAPPPLAMLTPHDEQRELYSWAHLELVEAATRTNARAIASEALRELDDRTPVNRTDWGLGVRARSAALLSEGARAEGLYHDAIELLGRSGTEVHHARAQLVYGEWLRRENRRVDVRVHLRATHAGAPADASAGAPAHPPTVTNAPTPIWRYRSW